MVHDTPKYTATHCNNLWAVDICSVLHCVAGSELATIFTTNCNTLQHICGVLILQCVAVCCSVLQCVAAGEWAMIYDKVLYTATHCNTPQTVDIAVDALCGRGQRLTIHDTLQKTTTHCNALPLTATHGNEVQRTATHQWAGGIASSASLRPKLQYTATHRIARQHTCRPLVLHPRRLIHGIHGPEDMRVRVRRQRDVIYMALKTCRHVYKALHQ